MTGNFTCLKTHSQVKKNDGLKFIFFVFFPNLRAEFP